MYETKIKNPPKKYLRKKRCLWIVSYREMENISRGHTFGDFVTIRRKASMQDITVAMQDNRVQEYRLPTPLNLMYCMRVSVDSQNTP
jgi:hypothetical protein